MVAVDHTNFFGGRAQVLEHDFANSKQNMKLRGFMIFPVEGVDVAENLIVDLPAAHIYDLVVAFMVLG